LRDVPLTEGLGTGDAPTVMDLQCKADGPEGIGDAIRLAEDWLCSTGTAAVSVLAARRDGRTETVAALAPSSSRDRRHC
jgi:hypothetical protein